MEQEPRFGGCSLLHPKPLAHIFGVWTSRRLDLVLPRDASVVCLRGIHDLSRARAIERTLRDLGWEVIVGTDTTREMRVGGGLGFELIVRSSYVDILMGYFRYGMCFLGGSLLSAAVSSFETGWWLGLLNMVGAGLCFVVGWSVRETNPGGLITAYRPWHLEAEERRDLSRWERSDLDAHLVRFKHISSGNRFVLANVETGAKTLEEHHDAIDRAVDFGMMHVGTVGTLSGLTEFAKLPVLLAAHSLHLHTIIDAEVVSLDHDNTLSVIGSTPTETGTLTKVKI